MNTATILGSHLNPQQSKVFVAPEGARKRWIWSQQNDHHPLLAAKVGTAALLGKPVVIWYDEESGVKELLSTYPLNQMEGAIYTLPSVRSNHPQTVLNPLSPAESIHHIELYKLTGDLNRIRKPWNSLHDELWPGTNRYALIQKYAGLFNHNSVNPLFYKLSRSMFEVSPAEYKKLRNKIEHHIKLSKLRQDGFDYMEILDVGLLVNHSLDFVKCEVMQYISLMSDKATELLKRADWTMLRYFNFVKTYWIREINIYVNKIDKLISHARELHLSYGDAFSFESSMSQLADKLKGQLSRKAKMISQDRKAIKTQYQDLLAEIESGQPWVAISAESKDNPTLVEAIDYLQSLKDELFATRDSIETHIRSQLKRLNSHNAPKETGLESEIKEWEDDLIKLYNDINISGYFKSRFESQALSIHRSAEALQEVNSTLSSIVERQHLLEDYFFWAGFQNQFPENANAIVQALHLTPVSDWLTYFDEWYISQLVTGDALEVEWPAEMNEHIKSTIERVRKHAIAECMNEISQRRNLLREENTQAIRKISSRSSAIDTTEGEKFFSDLRIEDRSEWFPVQILPLKMMPLTEEDMANTTDFILLSAKDPSLNAHWQQMQQMPCDVFADVSPLNQRYTNEPLYMPSMQTTFKLSQNRNSSALKYLTNISKQFTPFLSQTCIYAAHRVNVISFLGPELDRLVLDQLPMPYKISERSLKPDENHFVESLLEPNNPFVLLVRDFWPTGAWPDNSLWHLQFQQDLEMIGIKTIHSWSKGWLMESETEIRRVRDEILQHVGATFTGLHTTK